MPAAFHMTWHGPSKRWFKLHKGKRFAISCRQLAKWSGQQVPETKDGSYQLANKWWEAKRAEIEVGGESQAKTDYLNVLRQRQEWAAQNGLPEKATAFAREQDEIRNGSEWNEPQPSLQSLVLADLMEDQGHLNDFDREAESPVWETRLARRSKTAPEKTVGALIDRYLSIERSRVDAGVTKPPTYESIRICLEDFRRWAGQDTSIETIEESRWEDYFLHLSRGVESAKYRKSKLSNARSFLQWAGERKAFVPPANLHSRKINIRLTPKPVLTYSREEIQGILAKSNDRNRLFVMLALNAGMYQTDISELRQSEVDWEAGRITRRRTKTGHRSVNVPTVEYPLWEQTFDLLKKFRSDDNERVLLSEDGNPFVMDRIDDQGRRIKSDSIRSAWLRMQNHLPQEARKPFKLLRKTGASLLASHETYGRLDSLYLGHSPKGVAESHYSAVPQKLFDEAVRWLGLQLGI